MKFNHPECFELPRISLLSYNLYAANFSLMKLLPARVILQRAEGSGRLLPGGGIVETTSGTFGLALAILCAVRGYPLKLISCPTLVDDAWCQEVEQLGAETIMVDDPAATGNQDGRLAVLRDTVAKFPGTFWPCQYDNPDNASAYSRFAGQVLHEVGEIDCIVGPVGTGGSLFGTAALLRQANPRLRIVAVDTHRSALFGHAPGARKLRGLGNSIVPHNVRHEETDEVHWIGSLPAFTMTRNLASQHGLFVGPTSGAAALAAMWIARENPQARMLVVFPDEGHRYAATVHNNKWVSELEGWPIELPTEPIKLQAPEPASESTWTCFAWNRRSLSSVQSISEVRGRH